MRPILSLLLLLAACGRAAAPDPAGGGWSMDRMGDLCRAMRLRDGEVVSIDLSRSPGGSGIAVMAEALADIVPDRPYAGLALLANGAPVRAEATGAATGRGLHGVFFRFNPRRLLRRHGHGLRLAVTRGDRALHDTDLGDGRDALQALEQCARSLPRAPANPGPEAHSRRIRGSPTAPSISSAIAQTIASARSGERPGPS